MKRQIIQFRHSDATAKNPRKNNIRIMDTRNKCEYDALFLLCHLWTCSEDPSRTDSRVKPENDNLPFRGFFAVASE